MSSNPTAPTNFLLKTKDLLDAVFIVLASVASTVPKPFSIWLNCAKTQVAFICLPVNFCERFALHLRVFLEDFRVALP